MMASPLGGMDGLPPKDVALFKSTLKFFEHRQYKKGLKVCEQLVKRHPHHGESLAMKGLFLGHLGRKEEGYELIRNGIKCSLKSCVCWHVYGLLYRADKNYEEAMKCYRNALRFDKDNSQILRDLAVLQLQSQLYGPLCDTRYQVLVQRPALKQSWIALAMAYHLDQSHLQAVAILDAIQVAFPFDAPKDGGTPPSATRAATLERSELLLYKSMILEEAGRPEEALDALNSSPHPSRSATDSSSSDRWDERKAALLLALGRFDPAEGILATLLDSNPDSLFALDGLVDCKVRSGQVSDRGEALSLLGSKYPKSLAIQGARLKELAGTEEPLASFLVEHQLRLIRRGIPSAFSMVRPLYDGHASRRALTQFAEHLAALLDEAGVSLTAEERCWINLYLGQHFALLMEAVPSIAHFEAAVELQSELPDVFYYYARALGRFGAAEKAADCMDFARQLDRSDRFLNSQTVKYMLRAGRIDRAKELAVVFLKKGPAVEVQLKDLVDMQVLWFAHEMGRALQRRGEHELALEYFGQILKHFEDFYTDLFDFHNYIFRRATYCDYIRTLRYQAVICGEPTFAQTAHHALASLLTLHDERMQQQRAGQSVDKQLSRLSLDGGNENGQQHLERAKVWVGKLLAYRSRDPKSHRWAFEIYKREGGASAVLRAARALYQSQMLGGDDALIDPDATREFIASLSNSKDPVLAACGRLLAEKPSSSAGSCDSTPAAKATESPIIMDATPNLDRCISSPPQVS